MRRPARSALPRCRRFFRLACAAVLLALHLSGCITADGVLKADGTAALTLGYTVPQGATEAMQRERLAAPGITIESIAIAADRKVTAKLLVNDLAAIGKTALLKDTAVTTATGDGARTLTIVAPTKPLPRKPEPSVPGPSIRLSLPGTALDATEGGVVDGSTVKWTFLLRDWLERPEWRLAVRYRPDAAQPGAAPAAKPD